MPDQAVEFSESQLRHVAKLARLAVPDEQLHRFADQLAGILAYVRRIGEVDTTGVEPMAYPLPLSNVLRADEPGRAAPLEQVLLNAPQTDGPFFKVPKIFGADEE